MSKMSKTITVIGDCALEDIKLTGLDIVLTMWTDYIFVYEYPLDESLIISSLKRALEANPYFAGRRISLGRGREAISGNGEGVLVTIERCSEDISKDVFDGKYLIDPSVLLIDKSNLKKGSGDPVFLVKHVSYRNVDVLSVSVWHPLCDGGSFLDFLLLWSDMAHMDKRGITIFDRSYNGCKYNSQGASSVELVKVAPHINDIYKECALHLKEDFIRHLWSEASDMGSKKCPFLKDDVVAAYLWSSIAQCQNINPDEYVSLILVYDVRKLIGIDDDLFGNYLSFPFIEIPRHLLISSSLHKNSSRVREVGFQILEGADSLANDMFKLEEILAQGKILQHLPRGAYLGILEGTMFNNLTKEPFYLFNFGGPPPVFIDCPFREPIRNINVLPVNPNGGAGGILAKVNLLDSEMEEFLRVVEPMKSFGLHVIPPST